jgi:hypothetical protein
MVTNWLMLRVQSINEFEDKAAGLGTLSLELLTRIDRITHLIPHKWDEESKAAVCDAAWSELNLLLAVLEVGLVAEMKK